MSFQIGEDMDWQWDTARGPSVDRQWTGWLKTHCDPEPAMVTQEIYLLSRVLSAKSYIVILA